MPDNVGIITGTGATVATDFIGDTHHQRIKIQYGADGSATDASESDQLPSVPFLNSGATYGINAVSPSTATVVPTANQTGRKKLQLQNISDTIQYYGYDSDVTNTIYAFQLYPNQTWAEYIGTGITVYMYHTGSGDKNVAVSQFK